jgi:hypothetical protein
MTLSVMRLHSIEWKDGSRLVREFISYNFRRMIVVLVTINGVWIVNRFIDNLQIVTTKNYNSIADLHTTNHSTLSLLSLLSLVVTW